MLRKKIVTATGIVVGIIVSLLVNIVTGGTFIPLGPAWFFLVLAVIAIIVLTIASNNEQDSNIEKSPSVNLTSNTFSPSKMSLPSSTDDSRRSFLQGLFTGVGILVGGTTFVAGINFLLGIISSSNSRSPQKNLLFMYRGHSDSVCGVAWSPDGTRIASSSSDSTVQVWHARANPARIYTFKVDSGIVYSVTWSPDKKYIALGGTNAEQQAEIWKVDAQTGHAVSVQLTMDKEIYALVWSPHGKYIASGSMGKDFPWYKAFISVRDAGTLNPLYYKMMDDALLPSVGIYTVAWSPDERHIAFGGTNQTVIVWDATTGKGEITYEEHSDVIEAVAWSPNGEYIASGSKDRTVQIWNATTKIQLSVYREHSDGIEAVAWSPDSKYVASGSRDKTVRVWDAATGTTAYVYQGHTGTVYAVAWSPNGTEIASAGDDKTVQVWKPF